MKEFLKENHIKQKVLASQLGVSQGAISQWVTGRSQPAIKHLLKISALYDCGIERLIKKDAVSSAKNSTTSSSNKVT